ncbi:MAG: alpha/beta hydrolase [Thermoflexibacter sp.]|nr:alpha/beta hydrolase [Thermoflexibacter sp.]
MKKFLKGLLILLSLFVVIYVLGPRPDTPVLDGKLPNVTADLSRLEAEVIDYEKNIKSIKPNNEARIIWADSSKKQKTLYSVVYIHGFSASQLEGDPIHKNFAKRYNCNLYLARLEEHGIDTLDIFKNLTPEKLLASTKRAVAIGKQLGEKVIIMATSAGGMQSLYIASQNPDIYGLIIYSPLVDFYSSSSSLLDKPWGLQIAEAVMGDNPRAISEEKKGEAKYWTKKYRLEGLIALKSLVNHTMTHENFAKIKQPIFVGYYYKDEENQDKIVSVKAIKAMFEALGTPSTQKRQIAFPNVNNHVIASYMKSNDIASVEKETFRFAEEVLGLKPQ